MSKSKIYRTIMGWLMILVFALPNQWGFAQETLKYDVSVRARIVPLFAVDPGGNPVFDLKRDEIELRVNDLKAAFRLLYYRFTEPVSASPLKDEKAAPPYIQADRRVIFVILDSMNISETGFKTAREIIVELVSRSYRGSTFVILENSPRGVLRYIVGPEQDEQTLLSAVSQIKWYPEKHRRLLFARPDSELIPLFVVSPSDVKINLMERDGNAPDESFIQYDRAQRKREKFERDIYHKKITQFAHSLSQFKYVLQAVKEPKAVFLISEGLKKRRFYRNYKFKIESMDSKSLYNLFSLYYLDRIIVNINGGGAVLHTVNPRLFDPTGQPDKYSAGGSVSLKYMAQGSGGKTIEGSDIQTIAGEMKNTTSAYYELAYTPPPDMEYRQQIQVTCTRPGIRLFTPGFSEDETPYHLMNPVEKKMFALNVIHGGSWSRLSGTVENAVFRLADDGKKVDPEIQPIDVKIPENLLKGEVDVFVLRQDIPNNTIDIDLKTRRPDRQERLEIPVTEGQRSYFVIIEPQSVHCLYADLSRRETGVIDDSVAVSAKGKFSSLLQATSRRVVTAAGELKIGYGPDKSAAILLNGQAVYKHGSGLPGFSKRFLTPVGDVVTLRENDAYRLFILKPDGEYRISSLFARSPEQITCENGEVRLDHRPIPLVDQGVTEPERRRFYLFFARFRGDENFQLSRVLFPFIQKWFDPQTGNLIRTNSLEKSQWEHLTFRNTAEHHWSDPEIETPEARIYFEGEGLKLALVFTKKAGQWFLTYSRNQ